MGSIEKYPRPQKNRLRIGEITITDHFDLAVSSSEEIDAVAASTGETRDVIIDRNNDEVERNKLALASDKSVLQFLAEQ